MRPPYQVFCWLQSSVARPDMGADLERSKLLDAFHHHAPYEVSINPEFLQYDLPILVFTPSLVVGVAQVGWTEDGPNSRIPASPATG